MERLIQKLGVKRVKATIAIIVVLTLIMAPLSYVLPRAFAAEENISIQTSTVYNADNNTVDISITASPKNGVDAVIESISLPDGSIVNGNAATYTADKNDSYRFKVNYILTATNQKKTYDTGAPKQETEKLASVVATGSNDAAAADSLSQAITIKVNQIGKSDVTVKFMANGGGTFVNGQTTHIVKIKKDSPLLEHGDIKIILNNIDRVFAFWSANPKAISDAEAFDMREPLKEDITLYAIYRDGTNNRYEVTLDGNGGRFTSDYASIRVYTSVKGEPFSPRPTDLSLVKGDEKFLYWAWDKEGTREVDFPVSPTEDITFYAIYDPKQDTKHTVTLDVGKGTLADGTQRVNDIMHGAAFTKPSDPTPPDGKSFWHWSLSTDQKKEAYNFDTPVTKDIILAAQFAEKVYHVTYDPNGGSIEGHDPSYKPQMNYKHGEWFAALNPVPPEKKELAYWAYDSIDGEPYDFSKTAGYNNPKESFTLYAIYKDKLHKVTLDKNGGSFPAGVKTEYDVLDGMTFAEPAFTVTPPAGKVFDYWSENKDSSEAFATDKFDFSTKIKADTKLYAIYADDANGNGTPDYKETPHKVTLDKNGGSFPAGVKTEYDVLDGMTFAEPAFTVTPPAGKAFDYWSENKDSSEAFATDKFDFSTKIKADTTLYAIYADDANGNGTPDYKETSHKVTLDKNGGSFPAGVKTEYDVLDGMTFAQPAFTVTPPAGKVFDYWSLNASAQGGKDKFDFSAKIKADTKLYAIYADDANGNGTPDYKETSHKVTLDKNGGSFPAGEKTEYDVLDGMTFAQPAFTVTPPAGKVFDYWSLNASAQGGKDKFDFSAKIKADTKLYVIYADDANGNGIPDYKDVRHKITAAAGRNGIVAPNGEISVLEGTSKTIIIVPDTGYRIAAITVDGVGVRIANTYTFADVAADHTIHVTFVAQGSGSDGGSGGGDSGSNGGDSGSGSGGNAEADDADTTVPPSIKTDTGADTIAPQPIVINPDGTVNIDQIVPERDGYEFAGFQTPEQEIVDGDIPLDKLDTLEPIWAEIPDEEIALAQGHGGHNHILLIILLTLTSLTGGMLVYKEREKFLNEKEV